MNLSDLTTQFVGNGVNNNFGLMNRRDLYASPSLVSTFLNGSIMRIQRDLRCPAMEKWVTVTFQIGTVTYLGETYSIGAATYNSTTGLVTLTLANTSQDGTVNTNIVAGNTAIVAGLLGTGSVGSLNGSFTTAAGSGAATLCYTVATSLTLTVNALNTALTIPNDYLELIGIYPEGDWTNRATMDRLERVQNTAQYNNGQPLKYARQGGQWVLGPAPGIGQIIQLGYYAELMPLVNPTDTNIISIIAWDLIVYGALVLACEYYNDKRKGSTVDPNTGKIIDGFDGRYNQIFDALQDMGADDELNEGHMELCHAYPDDDTDNYEIWVP